MIGVALIWGINIPIMKTGLDGIDSFVFNAVRLVISASVLGAFAMAERRRGIRPKPGVTRRQIFTFGVMIGAVYQLLFLLGIDRTTSGNTALIISTVPVWTALLARIFIGERISRVAWAGLIVALTGTVIVAVQKGDVSVNSEHLLGNLIVLGAAITWSSGTVYSRRLLRFISPLQLSAAAAAVGLPLHLLTAMGRYEDNLPALQSGELWIIIVYAGVLSSGLALPMWNYGVRHAGAAHAAVIQNLIPFVAILVAWLSRGEPVTVPQLTGGALIITGLIIMRISRQREQRASHAESAQTTVSQEDKDAGV